LLNGRKAFGPNAHEGVIPLKHRGRVFRPG
jgi:hypothetical protein